ncbi:MAG: putative Mg2+ transporter-C (MgtC) family protein [Chloroflexota bacterium]|nr:putative Mg2+ transporter-C (MgtC) family protein [Chloroflexota bacterium]
MTFHIEYVYRLLAALVLGGIIGAERERHKKPVGLRTLILISLGSAVFTILSLEMVGPDGANPGRVAAQVVTGIGFLGAGVILEERGRVVGLTTAATIWIAAAVGMAAGAGQYILAASTSLLVMIVLLLFTRIEDYLEISSEERTYEITAKTSWDKYKEIKALFKEHGLSISHTKQEKKGDKMVCTFEVLGTTKKHDKVVQKLLSDKEIIEVWF